LSVILGFGDSFLAARSFNVNPLWSRGPRLGYDRANVNIKPTRGNAESTDQKAIAVQGAVRRLAARTLLSFGFTP